MKLETYEDLKNYLLAVMDYAKENTCKGNPQITKEVFWNMCMSACIAEKSETRIGDIIKKNILREFPEYLVDDSTDNWKIYT